MPRFHGKVSLTVAAGICCGIVFSILLVIRLGLLQENKPAPLPTTQKTPGSDTWHEIFLEDEKIGYSHRRVIPLKNGYSISEATVMRINTMGLVQDINVATTGILTEDRSLSEFTFQLKSSRFNFRASGKVGRKKIHLLINDRASVIPVKTPVYLTSGIFDAVSAMGIKIGETRTFNIFDPSSMGQRPVQVTFSGMEKVSIMGREVNTRRLKTDFMGAEHTAWVTLNGEVVKETGPLGITLKKSDARQALSDISNQIRDVTQLVAVDAGRVLEQTESIKKIVYKIKGAERMPDLAGGRQSLSGNVLTIFLEIPPVGNNSPEPDPARFLAPSAFVQSDHPDIVALAATIVAGGDSRSEKVLKIKNWIYTEIEKRPVLSVPNALETLENKMGDCNEHAVLFAALARAVGVPASIESGLVYLKGRFYYHAWNAVFIGRWITVDALMNQFPADVTHIRFARGGPDSQIDLMGAIGNIDLEILEVRND